MVKHNHIIEGGELPKQITEDPYENLVLVGVTGNSAQFYDAARHKMCVGKLPDLKSTDLLSFEKGSEFDIEEEGSLGEYILSMEKAYDHFTPFGMLMKVVSQHTETAGQITERQALIYGLRELLEIPRYQVATLLEVSPNTVDNTFSVARKKIEAMQDIADALLLPTGESIEERVYDELQNQQLRQELDEILEEHEAGQHDETPESQCPACNWDGETDQ